jgi:hypothetical protein
MLPNPGNILVVEYPLVIEPVLHFWQMALRDGVCDLVSTHASTLGGVVE